MGSFTPLLAKAFKSNILGMKKKKHDHIEDHISDRAATGDEVKVAAEKRRKKLQSGIDAKKKTSTLAGRRLGG